MFISILLSPSLDLKHKQLSICPFFFAVQLSTPNTAESAPYQLTSNSEQCWLVPFALPIKNLLVTPPNSDSLTDLPGKAVSEAICDFCSKLRLCPSMNLHLVLQDPVLLLLLVVVPVVFCRPGVQVPARLAMVHSGSVIRAEATVHTVLNVTLPTVTPSPSNLGGHLLDP